MKWEALKPFDILKVIQENNIKVDFNLKLKEIRSAEMFKRTWKYFG